MNATLVDRTARYSHATMRGIAFRIVGPVINRREVDVLLCEDDECDHRLSDLCWTLDVEETEDEDLVRAVMVGDDREHLVDREDLTVLAEDAYDPACGQIGCTCGQ